MREVPKCNVINKICKIKLRDWEYICPRCQGRGGFFRTAHYKEGYINVALCPLCEGEGKVDWIVWARQDRPILPMTRGERVKFKCPRNKKCKVIKRAYKREKDREKDLKIVEDWVLKFHRNR